MLDNYIKDAYNLGIQQGKRDSILDRECKKHKFDYWYNYKTYKLYKRGKNRCLRCGVKLWQTTEKKDN